MKTSSLILLIVVAFTTYIYQVDAVSCYFGRAGCVTSCNFQNCGTGYCRERGGRDVCVCSRCGSGSIFGISFGRKRSIDGNTLNTDSYISAGKFSVVQPIGDEQIVMDFISSNAIHITFSKLGYEKLAKTTSMTIGTEEDETQESEVGFIIPFSSKNDGAQLLKDIKDKFPDLLDDATITKVSGVLDVLTDPKFGKDDDEENEMFLSVTVDIKQNGDNVLGITYTISR